MDRDRALVQVVEQAEESTRIPVVVFGPGGCDKTAFLQQAAMLRELGYGVFYLYSSTVSSLLKPPFEEMRRLLGAVRLPWSL